MQYILLHWSRRLKEWRYNSEYGDLNFIYQVRDLINRGFTNETPYMIAEIQERDRQFLPPPNG